MKNVFLVLSLACFPIYFSELAHLGHCIQMIFTGLWGGVDSDKMNLVILKHIYAFIPGFLCSRHLLLVFSFLPCTMYNVNEFLSETQFFNPYIFGTSWRKPFINLNI